MATKQTLIITTTANRADVSSFPTLTGFSVVETTPNGTSTRYLVKTSDDSATWKAYDASSSTWKDVATQDITASSVMSEGMSKTALEAVPASAMTGFVGKSIDIAAAMQTTNDTQPTITSVTVKGESGATVTNQTTDLPMIDTTGDDRKATEILNIEVTKTESDGGTATVLASIRDESGSWSEYQEYKTYLTSPATTATGIKFRVVQAVQTAGMGSSTVTSIAVKHRMDSVATFSEGTGVCVTKTYNFVNNISRAHLMVKHPLVDDTEVTAQIALRQSPTTVTGEVLGTGNGSSQTVKLANTTGLASHNFVLYFDGVQQAASSYSFSPTDGQVTFTADDGVAVTADYVYGWSKETWVDFTHDTVYPDKNDNTLVDDQFDYIAGDNDPKGSVGTVRVSLIQKTGKEKDVALGTGNGKAQSFKLAHHAKYETIDVKPAAATWKFKDNTDVLTITAKDGEAISVSYSWAARPNYLESIACIFNE